MSISGGHLVLLLLLLLAARGLYVWGRGAYHRRRLPPPTLDPQQVEACERQAFREICRRAAGPAARVEMNDYFTARGWNRADALLVLSEPLKHGLIKAEGWSFGWYALTRRGWVEYRKNFMWTGVSEPVHISATAGGFIVANVNSPHAVAHGGHGNGTGVSHQQLVDALRQDAREASPDEAQRAQEYADDLAEAVQTANPERADRILGRINTLLSSASAAFSLTRSLMPPGN